MKQKLFCLFTGFMSFFMFLSIGLCIALFFRPIYYAEIERLQICETSRFSEEEIRANYDTLIDYCSPFNTDELKFPTFSSSKEALIHFAEVKTLFRLLLGCGAVSFALLLFFIIKKRKTADISFLRPAALITLLLPASILLLMSINFDNAFVIFHKIFFRNDYWLFSPETDPVITILPEAFFFDCAIIIGVTILLGSLLLEILYRIFRKKTN